MNWLMRLLPPIVVGPVIIVIGLGLATTAVDMAMLDDGEYSLTHFLVALVTLAITIIAAVFFKGFFGLIPILIGIVFGYIFALFQGIVVTTEIKAVCAEIASADSLGSLLTAVFQSLEFI